MNSKTVLCSNENAEKGIVKVQNIGHVKHKTTKGHARPIRKSEQELCKDKIQERGKDLNNFFLDFFNF